MSGPEGVYTEFHAGPPRMFSAAEFAGRQMKARLWLIPDMMPAGQVSSLDGDGGGGKSTIALQLSVCAVTGRSWLGQPVASGAVIYLASEDDEDEIHRRLDAITLHLKVGVETLGDLHVWPLAADDPALVKAGQDDAIETTARWSQLMAAISRIKPTYLILDSRADVFGGNEISRNQARGFIGLLRKVAIEHQLGVVILGHPSLSGIASGAGSSGSTHWRNAVRSGLYLRRPDDPEAHADLRVLEVKKNNYGPAGTQMTIRWSAGAFVLEGEPSRANRVDVSAEVDALFLAMVAAYDAQGRDVGDKPSANYAPTVFARDPTAKGSTRRGFEAAMNRLFMAGKIRVEIVGRASRQTRKIVVVTASDRGGEA